MEVAGGAEIFEVTVDEGAPIAGLTLIDTDREGHLPEETIIVAVVRNQELLIPRGETEIHAGDTGTVFAREGATEGVTAPFTES